MSLFLTGLIVGLSLSGQNPGVIQTPAPRAPPVERPTPTPPASTPGRADPAETVETAQTRRVCRIETVTGSRFGRTVCREVRQNQDAQAESREMLRRLQGARFPDG